VTVTSELVIGHDIRRNQCRI